MTRETAAMKAARILLDEKRTRHIKCSPQGLAFDVIGDSADGFEPKPYRVTRYRDGTALVEACSCPNGDHHPVKPQCAHMKLARLVMHITHGW